jgi:hypothetical protein
MGKFLFAPLLGCAALPARDFPEGPRRRSRERPLPARPPHHTSSLRTGLPTRISTPHELYRHPSRPSWPPKLNPLPACPIRWHSVPSPAHKVSSIQLAHTRAANRCKLSDDHILFAPLQASSPELWKTRREEMFEDVFS